MASLKETILSSADRERIQSPTLNKPKAKTVSRHQNGSDRNHEQQRNAVQRTQDKEEMSFRQEEEKARRSCLYKQGVKKNQLREEDRHQNKEERDRPRGLAQLQARELRHQEGIKVESKKSSFKSRQDDISGRGSRRESVAQKLYLEKEDRKHLQCAEERKQLQIKNAQAEKGAMEVSHYHASGIAESLPRYGTAQTREIKQKLERNKLLLSYEDHFDVDMQPKRLPPITTKAVTARRCLDPPRTEASHYHANGIEESLPRYGTAQSRAIKPNIERNQLRLSYEDTIEVRQQATPLPPITTTDKTECLVPAGMEAYQYRPKSVEELLPRCGRAQSRALKHELEDIKLLLSYLDNSDVDMRPTNLLPVTTKNVDAERCLDPAGIEAFHCHANGIQETLPRCGTAQSRAIKQKLEGNKLHLTYEDNIKVRQKPTPLPPITTTNETECLVPAGMESYQYCPESVEELLPRYSSTQTRAIKQKLEENKLLLLPYQECSDVDMRPTRPLTVTTKKVDAGRFLDPAGIEASQYHANGIEESLPRYGTAQTRAMKQKMEGNKQLLSYQENTKGYKQATRLPPISTKKTTVRRCLDPAGIEASHDHAEGVKESLPKYKTPQTRAIKKKLEETRKVNLLPKHLPFKMTIYLRV